LSCNGKYKNENATLKNDSIIIKQSTPRQDTALASLYSLAIKKYIETVQFTQKVKFDTLYFGKHSYGKADDFPDITLPKQIEKTQIYLVDPDTGATIQNKNFSSVYINLMGFVDVNNANFIFITFTNGFKHQYDYFIDFNYDSKTNKYILKTIEFEDYRQHKGEKPHRSTVYNDGKYL